MSKLTNEQLRRIRDDFGYFCLVVLGRELDPRQRAVFTSSARMVNFVAGRGAGKTTCAVMYALWRALREARHVVVWASSAEETAELGSDILRDFIDGGPLEAYIVERSAERVKFDNGSVLHFIPNSPRRARGFHSRWVSDYVVNESNLLRRVAKARRRAPSITLLVDESADVSEAVFTAALGVLSVSSDARAFFMGSAKGKDSWFYRSYLDGLEGDGETKSFCLSAEDCPWVDQDYLAEVRRKLDDATYRAEYCGEFMDALSSFFTAEMISAATAEYSIPAEHDDSYELVVSLDLAPSERFGSDFAVVAVVGRCFGRAFDDVLSLTTGQWRQERMAEPIAPHIKLFHLARFQSLSHTELRRELEKVKEMFPTCRRGICESFESQQIDAIVRRVVRRGQDTEQRRQFYGRGYLDIEMTIITPTNDRKHEAFSSLHQLIRERELLLPSDGDHVATLRRELLALQKEILPSGAIRFAAAKGHHDDTVMALLWATYLLRRERHSAMDLIQFREAG